MTELIAIKSTGAEPGPVLSEPLLDIEQVVYAELYEAVEGYFGALDDDLTTIPSAIAAHVESLQSRWL